jgi:hypothetical protein
MSGDELETKVRDHDEALRRIDREIERGKAEAERCNKEMIEGMRSLHKRLSMAQEYQLRDSRLTAEDIKEAHKKAAEDIKEALKEAAAAQAVGCAAHEGRIKDLEVKAAGLETYATKAENNIWWLDRWALMLTAILFSFLGWDTFNGINK